MSSPAGQQGVRIAEDEAVGHLGDQDGAVGPSDAQAATLGADVPTARKRARRPTALTGVLRGDSLITYYETTPWATALEDTDNG